MILTFHLFVDGLSYARVSISELDHSQFHPFMQMVMDGPKKQGEIPVRFRPAAVAGSEKFVYNSVKLNRSSSKVIPRHNQECDSPLMI